MAPGSPLGTMLEPDGTIRVTHICLEARRDGHEEPAHRAAGRDRGMWPGDCAAIEPVNSGPSLWSQGRAGALGEGRQCPWGRSDADPGLRWSGRSFSRSADRLRWRTSAAIFARLCARSGRPRPCRAGCYWPGRDVTMIVLIQAPRARTP